jgi:hypothetical protein
MITFKNILQEYDYEQEHRSEAVNVKWEADALIKKMTNNDLDKVKERTLLYRYSSNSDSILFIKPSQFERKSNWVGNIHNIIIDNSKYWEGYPKRSKSVVFTDAKSIQYWSGRNDDKRYNVIPMNNAKIVICPDEDFGRSFEIGLGMLGDLFDYSIDWIKIFNYYFSYRMDIDIYENISIEKLKEKFNSIKMDEQQRAFLHFTKGFKTLFEFVDYCLSPDLNGFKIVNYDDSFKNITNGQEMYTDSDCLLLDREYNL